MQVHEELINTISNSLSNTESFDTASLFMIDWVNRYPNLVGLLTQIGTIPESIQHDSSEEKLFSKVSDATLARAFRELGLKSTVLKERGDSADVQAESKYHSYSLVADAKAFRLSRTAKNQKDFKVVALSGWREDANYAVLCSPYFQYPSKQSQIFHQSLEHNVCLFSWEHLIYLIKSGIKETESIDLSSIWSWPEKHAESALFKLRKSCFISDFDNYLIEHFRLSKNTMRSEFEKRIEEIRERGEYELDYWSKQKDRLSTLSREEAIAELIRAHKIEEKIGRITTYVESLNYE